MSTSGRFIDRLEGLCIARMRMAEHEMPATRPLFRNAVILSEAKDLWLSFYGSKNTLHPSSSTCKVLTVHEENYFAYIVASCGHTLYFGITGNLHKRVFEHKNKLHPGFSATYNCNRLVWFERFSDPRNAIAGEKQLKAWLRAKKIALIEQVNPTWADLSDGWYMPEQLPMKPG